MLTVTGYSSEMFEVGVAERPLRGEDRSLVVMEAGLFGVFDGMGGAVHGARAAETAVDSVRETYTDQTLETSEDLETTASRLRLALEAASIAVREAAPGGGTTAVALRIVRPTQTVSPDLNAVWSAAGDSRLYHIHDDRIRQVTADEGMGHWVYNFLGSSYAVQQVGYFTLAARDQLVLVTDGITGDRHPDLLSSYELLEACADVDAQTAATNLVRASRKRDDKTAIVINL